MTIFLSITNTGGVRQCPLSQLPRLQKFPIPSLCISSSRALLPNVGKVMLGYQVWGRWLVDDPVRHGICSYRQHQENSPERVSDITLHYCYLFIVLQSGVLVAIVRAYPGYTAPKGPASLGHGTKIVRIFIFGVWMNFIAIFILLVFRLFYSISCLGCSLV